MTTWKVLILVCAAFVFVEGKRYQQKREAQPSICAADFNSTSKIQCYCTKSAREPHLVKAAECYLTVDGVEPDDQSWDSFNGLSHAVKIILTNSRSFAFKYIPTNGIKHTKKLSKLDMKYGNIEVIDEFAFSKLTTIEDIALRDNQIKTLKANSFAHHPNLKSINLELNNIVEINRDVFIDLPVLRKLFLTSNKITTIHDRAFVHLSNLKELEINRNKIFSLNSESFSGLQNLERLDLSSNSLEVIGDNTFLPLNKLRVLALDENKIQMIDERGFHGLLNLQALSLARNMLTNLDNVNVFEGLTSLTSLNLKANQLQELKKEVIAPILSNFYGNSSNLDVEDINFPCDCRLEWFMDLMNKTNSTHLKQALENFKCVPDPVLRERYNNSEPEDDQELQKSPGDEVQGPEYEFYDDTQLDGKLFYTDIRYLLNCSESERKTTKVLTTTTTQKPIKEVTPVLTTTVATRISVVTTVKPAEVTNEELGLFAKETTKTDADQANVTPKPENQERKDIKANSYTTNRLATVSAKPVENKYEEHHMASDEAKPDNIKAHRSIQDDIKDYSTSNANPNIGFASMLMTVVLLRFY